MKILNSWFEIINRSETKHLHSTHKFVFLSLLKFRDKNQWLQLNTKLPTIPAHLYHSVVDVKTQQNDLDVFEIH